MKLAVIGGGPTGIISAILASRRPGEIDRSVARDIFESTKAFRGRSFDTDSTNMLLNTSIGLNSLDPRDPDRFHRFLFNQEGVVADVVTLFLATVRDAIFSLNMRKLPEKSTPQ
jgi:uncharacterized NAD(P)/FAD-binding protein YdhS